MTGATDGKVNIYMFGSFEIECGGKILSINSGRTKQLWMLLGYLIANRNQDISQMRLSEVLWEDDVDNPAGALKNLVYRLRNMLNQIGRTPEREYILSGKGSYSWNNEIPCTVDAEEFEKRCTAAKNTSLSAGEKIELYSEAIDLYRGEFLSLSPYEKWVVPLAEYYRNLFFTCVNNVCKLLIEAEMYEKMDNICSKAITIDPFEESAQILKMKALSMTGKYQQALSHYDYVTTLFYRELGVQPSEDMRGLYRELVKRVNEVETDLALIKEDLNEDGQNDGTAFYCGFEVFKYMYRLEARSIERVGQSVFIGLLTLVGATESARTNKNRENAMEVLGKSIANSLRRGDVYSRFSATQYIFMIPTLNIENSKIVMKRVKKAFDMMCKVKDISLDMKIMPINPAS